MKREDAEKDFIREKFREYYAKEDVVLIPTDFERREFGFLLFDEGMLRHKGFKSPSELHKFLRDFTPSNVYYSCAYYENPEARMDEKGWLGADLIFDIDADHIPTPCKKNHDTWICPNCGFAGRGENPGKCPNCSSEKFETRIWACELCLEAAKAETLKLLDMLLEDFGFSEKEIAVFFSGHRGYHVHVEGNAVRGLDSVARKEIVDYVSGLGLDPSFHGLRQTRYGAARLIQGPNLDDEGWRGRIAKGVYDFVLTASEEDFLRVGLPRKTAKTLVENRGKILESWKDNGPWSIVKGVGLESWKKIVARGIYSQSAKIDTVVTTDIHRLIRLGGTLHGKTGMRKVLVDSLRVEEFDPLKEGIAFKKGFVKVFVAESPKLRVGDEYFGPFKSQTVELPTAAAMLLLCKGAAKVVKEHV